MLLGVGLDARELAEVAKLTDVLNRHGIVVSNIGAITPTDYGLMFNTELYIQTRKVPEDAQAGPETDRAEDAGEVSDQPVVERVEDDDDDE